MYTGVDKVLRNVYSESTENASKTFSIISGGIQAQRCWSEKEKKKVTFI